MLSNKSSIKPINNLILIGKIDDLLIHFLIFSLIALQLNLTFSSTNLNSGTNTNITSSNLTTQTGNLNITSGTSGTGTKGNGSTNILTDTENDYSSSFNSKKSPSIMAAMGNGITKAFNDLMPNFSLKSRDETQSNNEISEIALKTNSLRTKSSTQTNVASNLSAGADPSIASQNNNLIKWK